MIISSIFLSNSMRTLSQMNGILNGSLTMGNSYEGIKSDILQQYDAQTLLGYDSDTDGGLKHFIRDIENGTLEGLPYIKINGNYLFSKKALEEWLYHRSLKQITQ